MSDNDLVSIPDSFKNAPLPAAFAGLNPQEESLTEGIGSSFAVISYRGKNWTFRYKGQTHLITYPSTPGRPLPTDGQPSNYIDVIILRKARNKSKSYYAPKEDGGGFSPDDIDAHKKPDCTSMDGIVPDDGVKKKQSDTCALCPQNEWKPQPNGRPGRACQDRMRLAVIITPSMITPLLGAPLLEPMFLPIPPASLQGLSALGDEMEKNGKHFSTYVTRIEFKPEKSWPEFKYKVVKMLTDAEAGAVVQLRADPQCLRIIGDRSAPVQVHSGPRLVHSTPQIAAQAEAERFIPGAVLEHQRLVEMGSQAGAEAGIAAVKEAERKARIAAVRASGTTAFSEAPLVKAVPIAQPTKHPTSEGQSALEAQIEELKAKLAAQTTVQVQAPAPEPVQEEMFVPASVESTPDMDALIASMMPKKPS